MDFLFGTDTKYREYKKRIAQASAKEKAERWDDLLQRSERAGGTLKMGGEELESDRFRFSNISENFT